MHVIPILLYHGITTTPSSRLSSFAVEPAMFARQLDLLHEANYRLLTVSEFIDERKAGPLVRPTDRVALITFDDGYADFVEHALPALQARSFASTMYVTTGWVGPDSQLVRPSDPVMTWDQIADVHAQGVEIGSHSHTHPQLDTLGRSAAFEELVRSKALLEDAIGSAVRSFAYPHGYNSPQLQHQLAVAGYDSGAAVRNALSHDADNAFALARLTVMRDTSLATFAEWIGLTGVPVAASRTSIKTLGWRYFRRGRAVVSRRPGTDYR